MRPFLPLGKSKTLVALSVMAAAFVLGVIVLLAMLNEREQRTEQGIREDALWATFQLDRDTTKLDEALAEAVAEGAEPTPQTLQNVALKFDVLFSQMKLVNSGDFLNGVVEARRFRNDFASIRQVVIGLAPTFDRFQETGKPSQTEIAAVRARVSALRRSTEELLAFTNARMNELRVDARSEEQRLSMALAAATFTLLLIMLGVVGLLIRQITAEASARLEVERLAASLKDAALAAEAGNRAKSAFLATVGHEIRTPLNGIIGMVEVIRESRLNADQTHCLDVVSDCGATLLDLINDVLDFSKFESGEFPISPVAFDPAQAARSTLSVAMPRAKLRGNALTLTIDPQMPEACLADPSRVRQVLGNLVGNAVKFTERGRVDVVASFKPDPTGPRLRFEVRDTGIGIAPEAHGKIFREFSQVDASINRRYGGTGLGLSISKRIVERLGGSIGFTSQPGQGSCFWFEVPAPATRLPASRPRAEPSIERASILVVEDNAVNREVVFRILQSLGQDVTVAEDGPSGVEAVRQRPFDLILMDVQMPGMDGLEATKMIRNLPGDAARTKIIALTASASNDDREACINAGMDGFISKPITLAQVKDLLAESVASGAEPPEPARLETIAETPAFDPARVAEMTDALGAADFAELVAYFMADAKDLIARLEKADASGDWEASSVILHTLRGAALNCGCARIGDLCARARAEKSTHMSARLRSELDLAREQLALVT